jgi:hypothetical protein
VVAFSDYLFEGYHPMGLMRFVVSPPDRITEEMVQQAYMSGFEYIPWRSRIRGDNAELIVERAVSDSGRLTIPWLVEGDSGRRQVALSTASLRERPEPYHLPLELARGKISQVRNQLAEWRTAGLMVPRAVHDKIAEAMKHFGEAAIGPPDSSRSVKEAEQALSAVLEAADRLTDGYTEQALSVRRRAAELQSVMLGAELGVSLLDDYTARVFLDTFNAARVPIDWSEVEATEERRSWEICDRQIAWCRANRLAVCGGPLLQLDPRGVPDWLYLFEGDFGSVQSTVSDFVEAAVGRYRGKVDLWVCAARANTAEVLSLSEEETVQLTAQVLERTRALDPDTPVVVSFDQPWAEYVSRREVDFPPLYFADALIRAGLAISGLMLEINMGYHPGGTLPRDALEFSRWLDHWGVLGVPLYVTLCAPSSASADPLARRQTRAVCGPCTPKTQQAWVHRYLPILLSKSYVYGVFWNQLHDAQPHDFPHGGLFDLRRHPKPAMRTLASLRQAHLRQPGR